MDNILQLYNSNLKMRLSLCEKAQQEILHLNLLLESAFDEHKIDRIKESLFYQERILKNNQGIIEHMRVPADNTDKLYRNNIKLKFASYLSDILADNIPLFFHGVGSIVIVKQIIETGKICSTEQLINPVTGIDEIFVAGNYNLSEAVDISDSPELFMPYGAIFVINPLEHELEKIMSKNGDIRIKSVNFVENPNRLLNIISSPENIINIKSWCRQNNINEDKVLTHNNFIKKIENLVLENDSKKNFNDSKSELTQ